MTSESRARDLAKKASAAAATATDALAAVTFTQHADVLHAIGGIELRLDAQDGDLREIKRHVKETNGRVTAIELWKANLTGKFEGLAQGAGGTGRLILSLLGAASLLVGMVLTAVSLATR